MEWELLPGGPGHAEAPDDEEEGKPDGVEGGLGSVPEDGKAGGGGIDVAGGFEADGVRFHHGSSPFFVRGGAVDALDAVTGEFLALELVAILNLGAVGDVGIG